jgi:hypothetical protein
MVLQPVFVSVLLFDIILLTFCFLFDEFKLFPVYNVIHIDGFAHCESDCGVTILSWVHSIEVCKIQAQALLKDAMLGLFRTHWTHL